MVQLSELAEVASTSSQSTQHDDNHASLLSSMFYGAGGEGSAHLISQFEAESYVEALKEFALTEVGNSRYFQQLHRIEQLNVQAHHNAARQADEFVKDALLVHDKLNVLVRELLTIEAWKQLVLTPHLLDHMASVSSLSLPAYLLARHEGVIVNLLEVVMFHKETCEGLCDDALLELSDYCHRQLAYLNGGAGRRYADDSAKVAEATAQQLMAITPLEDLHSKLAEVRFQTATASLSILRYLTDYMTDLPPCVIARTLDTNDEVMTLVPLLEDPPWVRRRKKKAKPAAEESGGDGDKAQKKKPSKTEKVTEKYLDGRWTEVARDERARISPTDAQCWLAVYNLIVEPKCRMRYHWDDYRVDKLALLKRHFNDILFDQLPLLRDLARIVDEIIMGARVATQEEARKSSLVLEQVPVWRESLVKGRADAHWKAIAEQQKTEQFHPTQGDAVLSQQSHAESMMKAYDFMAEMGEGGTLHAPPSPRAGTASLEAVAVTVTRSPPGGGPEELVFRTDVPVDFAKAPEEVHQSAEQYGVDVSGRRWRCAAPPGEKRTIPSEGRVQISYGGASVGSAYTTPTPPAVRGEGDDVGIPSTAWLTLGTLGSDGHAFQLKLKRCDAPGESGGYYRIAGGALSLRGIGK